MKTSTLSVAYRTQPLMPFRLVAVYEASPRKAARVALQAADATVDAFTRLKLPCEAIVF